ncbi:hypothetical protein HOY80DRAFT_1055723 [Tuber brumale]|nr:hypothetical protein HOY80DRAFT_1055723 [Tuber brumale]
MSTQSGRTDTPTFVLSEPLKLAQLASMEVAKEGWAMVGEEHRDNFVVVGGAALLHGYPIFTSGANLAITAQSLHKFRVNIDFLDKTGETGCLHQCSEYSLIDGILVATLVDLAIGKGGAWIGRGNSKDLYGFKCAVKTMTKKGLDFKRLSEAKRETLDDITIELGGKRDERVSQGD